MPSVHRQEAFKHQLFSVVLSPVKSGGMTYYSQSICAGDVQLDPFTANRGPPNRDEESVDAKAIYWSDQPVSVVWRPEG